MFVFLLGWIKIRSKLREDCEQTNSERHAIECFVSFVHLYTVEFTFRQYPVSSEHATYWSGNVDRPRSSRPRWDAKSACVVRTRSCTDPCTYISRARNHLAARIYRLIATARARVTRLRTHAYACTNTSVSSEWSYQPKMFATVKRYIYIYMLLDISKDNIFSNTKILIY